MKVLFHSCGAVRPILPDLIDMGVDALEVFQINAAGMEPRSIAKEFGGRPRSTAASKSSTCFRLGRVKKWPHKSATTSTVSVNAGGTSSRIATVTSGRSRAKTSSRCVRPCAVGAKHPQARLPQREMARRIKIVANRGLGSECFAPTRLNQGE